jgi:hypothetical protein
VLGDEAPEGATDDGGDRFPFARREGANLRTQRAREKNSEAIAVTPLDVDVGTFHGS